MNDEDIKNLNLLSTFHYIVGAIMALFSCMHVIGIYAVASGKFFPDVKGVTPPPFFRWIFIVMGTVIVVFSLTITVCVVISGKKLRKRRSRIFCMVIAGIECTFTPLGTVLGVFTIIVLTKDSVKEIFAQQLATS